MHSNELLTKSDLTAFENKIIATIEEKIKGMLNLPFLYEQDRLLTRTELMKFLGITENTFKELQEKGLPYVPVGKRARYDKGEIVTFLRKSNLKL